MKRLLLVLLVLGLTLGCKGPKGDTGPAGTNGTDGTDGEDAIINYTEYTGTPTTNPYDASAPAITNEDNQIVQVFMVTPVSGNKIPLPRTYQVSESQYRIHRYQTYNSRCSLTTSDTPWPATALYQSGQCTYLIQVYTFSSIDEAQSYQASSAESQERALQVFQARSVVPQESAKKRFDYFRF